MAHLVRPQIVRYIDPKTGKRVPKGTPGAKRVKEKAAKWYGKGVPGWPPKKRVPLATDKGVARKMLNDLVEKAERGIAGMADREEAARPIAEHLSAFEAHLKAGEATAKQVRIKIGRARAVIEGCGFELLADIQAAAVRQWLARQRRERKDGQGRSTFGAATSNYHLREIKSFCKWLVEEGRLDRNPLARLKPLNVETDQRHARRTLTTDEARRLLDAAAASPKAFRGLSGADRRMLYALALGSGLREGTIAALCPEHFTLDQSPPAVLVAARSQKNRRTLEQPIPGDLAAELRAYLKGRPNGVPVWPGTWSERAAKMLRMDLEPAKIPYAIDGPDGKLFADFHALKHTYVAELERAGVPLKTASALAQHSDIKLTAKRYGRATKEELAAAADKIGLFRTGGGEADPLALAAAFWQAVAALLLAPDLVVPGVVPAAATAGDGGGRPKTKPRPKESGGAAA